MLGLPNARRVTPENPARGSSIWLTRCAEWIHVADGWSYALWHQPDRIERLCELSRDFDVFTCASGDIDVSYDYAWFRGGEVVRRRVVHSPNRTDRVVVVDDGAWLPVESTSLFHSEGMEIGLSIARFLGVDTRHGARPTYGYDTSADFSDACGG